MWWCCSLFSSFDKAGVLRVANLWGLASSSSRKGGSNGSSNSNPWKAKKDAVHPRTSALRSAAPFCPAHDDDRSSSSSKRSLKSPPFQRQRCVQLDAGEEEGGASKGRLGTHLSSASSQDARDVVLEVDTIRVRTATPSPEVPLVVVAASEGGTRTHALGGRSRVGGGSASGRSRPLQEPRAHRYGSASFDLARGSGCQGARAAFHASRSSFEVDRRLSMTTAGGSSSSSSNNRAEKSPGSARRLPSIDRPSGNSSSSSQQQNPEGGGVGAPSRAGFRRCRSERVGGGGSSAGSSPARSESLRVTKGRYQDVEMTELCSPRRLHSYEEYSSSSRLAPERSGSPSAVPPASGGVAGGVLMVPCPGRFSWRTAGLAVRRQSSLESGELEDLMENRRRLLLQADSTTPSDEDEEPRSKVRYNDMGSLEQVCLQVNEEIADLLDDSSVASSDNQEKIKVQCRALWQLRTTLEEEDPEEPDSDYGRMEVHSSPDRHSPGRASDLDNVTSATSHTTSFESNTEAIVVGGGGDAGVGVQEEAEGREAARDRGQEAEGPQPPMASSEARRTSYRAILASRLKQLDAPNRPPLSTENSFDSVDTECSSTTDLSRPEGLTTSFDSTTDSTSDTHSHRLQQMKADSGYRSLEANSSQGGGGRPPRLSKKQIHFVDEGSVEAPEGGGPGRDRSRERHAREQDSLQEEPCDPQVRRERLRKGVAQFERRWGKSQAKKRREALRERHFSSLDAGLGGSLEGDPSSSSPSAAAADEVSGKRSVLARFLRTHRYPAAHYRLLQRDYSIDERSDRLFKEFSRTEAPLEWESHGRRGPRPYCGRRLHRHLEAAAAAAADGGSPRSHRRKLSPQDSIEEEDQLAAALWEGDLSRPGPFEEVPPFPLAEEAE